MKTSIIGYPRIGALRELKFASEKYFRSEIDAAELEKTAKEIRTYNLNLQKESGLDFIPSNDFSYYDGLLDTAFLLNAVPERYTSLGLSALDTYFAAARGYQGEKGDVKALAMKKWYNTNYHYMVPEIDDATDLKLAGTKPFDLFSERSHPDFQGVTPQQYENRMLLRRMMLRHGFEPIDCEWWHFTLKDEPYPDTLFAFPVSSAYLKR